jgi:hypothetical protein
MFAAECPAVQPPQARCIRELQKSNDLAHEAHPYAKRYLVRLREERVKGQEE